MFILSVEVADLSWKTIAFAAHSRGAVGGNGLLMYGVTFEVIENATIQETKTNREVEVAGRTVGRPKYILVNAVRKGMCMRYFPVPWSLLLFTVTVLCSGELFTAKSHRVGVFTNCKLQKIRVSTSIKEEVPVLASVVGSVKTDKSYIRRSAFASNLIIITVALDRIHTGTPSWWTD